MVMEKSMDWDIYSGDFFKREGLVANYGVDEAV